MIERQCDLLPVDGLKRGTRSICCFRSVSCWPFGQDPYIAQVVATAAQQFGVHSLFMVELKAGVND
jgi:hypothetical protein